MNIRIAKPGDEKSIAQVIINTWKYAYQGIIPQSYLDSLTPEKSEALLKEQLALHTHTIHVLETESHQIVGMVSGGGDRSGKYDCEIIAIYIDRSYQKYGFGRRLFQEQIQAYRDQGYRSMIIWTLEKNKDRVFYDKMGGVLTEKKTHPLANEELPMVGFVWEDIRRIRN